MSGLEERITGLLTDGNREGGFPVSLVCTDQGLLVAAAGEGAGPDDLAVLASLFDDVVARARRDMAMAALDELTLRDATLGRFVIRPLALGERRMFLVVHVPPALPWRRTTNRLCARLESELARFAHDPGAPDGH